MAENETKKVRLSIGQRINEVRKKLPYIKKEKAVTGQGYKAVTHDQVTAMIRPLLIEYGIITVAREIAGELAETKKESKAGTPATAYVARYEVDYCCDDDVADKVTTITSGIGEDFGDKGPGKALSYAVKGSMLKMFNVETGEDDESRLETQPIAITDETIAALQKAVDDAEPLGMNTEGMMKRLKNAYGCDSYADLSDVQGKKFVESINIWVRDHEPK